MTPAKSPTPLSRRAIALGLALALGMLAIACAAGPCAGNGPEEETVRGLVLEVNARSVLELESLRLEDESGRVWLFHGNGGMFPGFSPSHIREHMVGGLPLGVTFQRREGLLVITRLED